MTLTPGQQKVLDTLNKRFKVDFVPTPGLSCQTVDFDLPDFSGSPESYLVRLTFVEDEGDSWAFCGCSAVDRKLWGALHGLFPFSP